MSSIISNLTNPKTLISPMEEKRRDSTLTPPPSYIPTTTPATNDTFPALVEPASARRRSGALKRKANHNNGSNSAPSKRFHREKFSASVTASIPMHSGPYTRAAAASSALPAQEDLVEPALEASALASSTDDGGELWRALESEIEAEFEAIRSRHVNAHLVPTHCGWFSWTNVHSLEEQTLTSFFNGKSENRTPKVYLEIRNWIMKKFHADPNINIELGDLSELTFGDLDARQEVMEFLDYWGLINFHPFPPAESTAANADDQETMNTDSLVKKLYHFETLKSGPPVVPRTNNATWVPPPRLFMEPVIAEELMKPEKPEPEVEYHCNSCSGDCSRKRYHCQTQADYDLCTECFINGKFGSTMSSSDFILMEPAEVPGVSGGNWTDQETLLLLEALELFSENWNEIAEHVATKTKAQCILHFVQMPIEDSFLDCNEEIDTDLQQNVDPTSTNQNSAVPIDASKSVETKNGANDDQPSIEISKDSDGIKVYQEKDENCAVKALNEAFEAVGSILTPGDPITFVEAGNPVMAMAAFLSRLADPDTITASSHCSIKSISCASPSLQVAARHCFVLEDPPDEKKEPVGSESSVTVVVDQNAQKEEKRLEGLAGDSSNEQSINKIKDSAQDGRTPLISSDMNCIEKGEATKGSDRMVIDLSNSEVLSKEDPPSMVSQKDLSLTKELTKDEIPSTDLPKAQPLCTEVLKDSQPSFQLSKDPLPTTELLKDQPPSHVKESGDEVVEASTGSDMICDLVSVEKKQPDLAVRTNSAIEIEANTGNDQARSIPENYESTDSKDDPSFNNIKRAAITALSAAAVKAKLLANQEEDQIRQLATMLIDKQLHKLETKLAFFNEMDSVVMRVKEQLERSRQKLYQERAQIIAARLGMPPSSSRAMPQSLPTNRVAMNFANLVQRPSMNMTSQRPLNSRPMTSLNSPSSNPFGSTLVAGNSIRPSNQDKLSSIGMK